MSAVPHLDPESIELHALGQGAATEHLSNCEACRFAVQRARARRQMLGVLEERPLPAAAFARVEHRLFDEKEKVRPRPLWGWAWGVVVAAAIAAWGFWVRTEPARPEPKATAVRPAHFNARLTLLEGEVERQRSGVWSRLSPNDTVAARDRLRTLQGRVAFSVGPGRGATLGPEAEMALEALLPGEVRLSVERGQVSCAVSPLSAQESFLVRAGQRFVRVVGTQFAVTRAPGEVRVEVEHGTVVVSDTPDGPGVRVTGPGRLDVLDTGALSSAAPAALAGAAAQALATRPEWMWAAGPRTGGAVRLDVDGLPGGARVQVDSAGWGWAPVYAFVDPGLHVVRARVSGEAERVSRVTLLSGSGPVGVDLPRAPALLSADPAALAAAVRDAAGAHRPELTYCYEHALKQGPLVEGRLVLELSVNAEGRVASCSAVAEGGAVLPQGLAQCIVRSVREWKLPAGMPATLELPVDLTPRR